MSLVLTRKENEQVVFILQDGQEIIITLGRYKAGQTKLIIDAPSEIEIWREELLDRLRPAFQFLIGIVHFFEAC